MRAVSYPAPHPRDVVVICRSELTTHFCFFKGNVDPIGSSKQGYGGTKHWPRADPDCDAKGKNNEAQASLIAVHKAQDLPIRIGCHFGQCSMRARYLPLSGPPMSP